MAKSQQKSNREVRKPKSTKPKPIAQGSPFERGLGAASPKATNSKKGGAGKR